MKLTIKGKVLLASLIAPAFVCYAPAIERPKVLDEQPAEKVQLPAEKIAMLGVGGMRAGEALASQLDLEHGKGLTLFHIQPDSAAAKAGLQEHDVITEFDGTAIGSQDDLRRAVMACKPGDAVTVKFIRKAKAQSKEIVLGERDAVNMAAAPQGIAPEWIEQELGKNLFRNIQPNIQNEEFEQFRKQLRDQLKERGFNMDKMLDMHFKRLNEIPEGFKRHLPQGIHMNASSSVTVGDDKGSITIKTSQGNKELIVKDKQGNVVFQSAYDTPNDRAAVPDDIAKRIEQSGIENMRDKMKLRFQRNNK